MSIPSQPSQPNRQDLVDWCVAFVADMLERPRAAIDPDARFSRLGFDSAMSVQLVVALEGLLAREISPDLLTQNPTINRLVAQLTDSAA